MVRSSGFEPPRYCYRQPLKLVRLPVPPRPRGLFSSAFGRRDDQTLKPKSNPKRAGFPLSIEP